MLLLSNPPPTPPPPQDSPPTQKKVTFAPGVEMRFIKKTKRSTAAITWYQPRHYEAFQADCRKTAEMARDLEGLGNLTHGRKTHGRKEISTRGLEHYVDEEKGVIRNERRLAAWDLVLDEQWKQYERGDYQPQLIAEVYQEVSVRSQFEARIKALQYMEESELFKPLGDTNFRAMLTRRPGMKNVYDKCKALLYVEESEAEHRIESKLCEAQKSCKQSNTPNLRAMFKRRPSMRNVHYKRNTNLRTMLTRRPGMKNIFTP
jgi:hypothetical protein